MTLLRSLALVAIAMCLALGANASMADQVKERLDAAAADGSDLTSIVIDTQDEFATGRKVLTFGKGFWKAFKGGQEDGTFTYKKWQCDQETEDRWKCWQNHDLAEDRDDMGAPMGGADEDADEMGAPMGADGACGGNQEPVCTGDQLNDRTSQCDSGYTGMNGICVEEDNDDMGGAGDMPASEPEAEEPAPEPEAEEPAPEPEAEEPAPEPEAEEPAPEPEAEEPAPEPEAEEPAPEPEAEEPAPEPEAEEPAPEPTASPPAGGAMCGDAMISDMISGQNGARADEGHAPLSCNEAGSEACMRWSGTQCDLGDLEHNLEMTKSAAGFGGAAENVLWNPEDDAGTVAAGLQAWLESEGHHDNMMGEYTEIGCGYHRCGDGRMYWTCVYGNP